MATLTVEYIKKNYASLKDIPDDKIAGVLHRLTQEDWISTTTDLENTSRDALMRKKYPLLFLNALKPGEEEGEKFTTFENVQKWLVDDRGVPERVAVKVAQTLFEGGYIYPSSLLDIRWIDLDSLHISPPHKNILFNKLQQQQQQLDATHGTTSALERIEKKLDDMATIDVPMSEVTLNFTSSLLDALNIKYFVRKVNKEIGEGRIKTYTWGEKEHEADGQPSCQQILEKEILPLDVDGDLLGIYDVRNRSLPELQAGKRKSNGYSDLALGPRDSMAYAVTNAKDLVLSYAVALVELKTSRRDLKPGQLLLQLVSLALVSGTSQGVVVLGTDCDTKWRLLHFSNYNTVVVQPYEDGKKCIADFKNLIAEGTARMQRNTAPEKSTRILEDDNADVNMNDFDLEEAERDTAIEREAKLQKLAGALGSLFGETLDVPSWAKASATCPSYYM